MPLSASYSSSATAADIGFDVIDVSRYNYAPLALFMDIPLLSYDHRNAGFYCALYGKTGAYRGGVLKMSSDGGSAFRDLAYFDSTPAVVGRCTSAPGAGGGVNVLDYSVALSVDFSTVAVHPSSATDADLWTGSNLAALGNATLGWELLQFKTATLVSGYSYTLTGLLRGLYGTAWRCASHVSDEHFVILDDLTGIQRISLSEDQIGTGLLYRATNYDLDTSYISETFTNAAVGLECYAPTQITGTRNSSRDLAIAWKRNDRLAFTVPDLGGMQQVPMSESSESYEIDIRNALDTATLRTITATSQTASYTAAQQTTDFGSAQNSIKVRVYQLSATMGRGYAGAATL